MYNFNKINDELNQIVQMHQEAKMQKTIMQSKEKLKQAELSSIRTKYGFMLFHSLSQECYKMHDEFTKNLLEIQKSSSEKNKINPLQNPLYMEICNSKNAHVSYIGQIQRVIEKSPTLAIADNHYNSLKDKQREYKYEFAKNTEELRRTYIDEINRAQSAIIAAERQSNQLSQQQQLESALKQLEEMRALKQSAIDASNQKDQIINQLRNDVNSLQQQHENDLKNIEELQESARQYDNLGQREQRVLEFEDVFERLKDISLAKTQEADENNAKFLQEKAKVDSANTQIGNFIDNHPGLEDIDILIQIKEILGDSQPQVDII